MQYDIRREIMRRREKVQAHRSRIGDVLWSLGSLISAPRNTKRLCMQYDIDPANRRAPFSIAETLAGIGDVEDADFIVWMKLSKRSRLTDRTTDDPRAQDEKCGLSFATASSRRC